MSKLETIEDYKKGRKLTLDYMILYQMISDPKFWCWVPAFAFLKTTAQAAEKSVTEAVLSGKTLRDCFGCSSVQPLMMPLFNAFAQHIAQLHEDSPEALDDLVLYIASRRKYRPTPIEVYYLGDDGKKAQVQF